MFVPLTLLLLPVAATCGWFFGYRDRDKPLTKNISNLRRDYFRGLNYLINAQPDKAVDVFIKLLEVDSDTIETHLALGNLFRQRGEVDRAIRIHQNLIARPQLEKTYREQALFALGQDYLRAGVLDRAERLFLELVRSSEEKQQSLQCLLIIYQQEKDWLKAIDIAKQLQVDNIELMQATIAQYYCELAEEMEQQGKTSQAHQYLKRAQSIDKNCARTSLIQGRLNYHAGLYKEAIQNYQQVREQNPDYLSETIPILAQCYKAISQEEKFIVYLYECLEKYPRIAMVSEIANYLQRHQDDKEAIDFLVEHFKKHPSVRCLSYLVNIYIANSLGDTKDKLTILQNFILLLLSERPLYQCSHCGYAGKILFWQCPGCHYWGSVKPMQGLEKNK